jgi:hypothetical protein
VTQAAIPAALSRLVRTRAGDVCEYCLLPQSLQEATFHIDHIRPRSAGGTTAPANLALACVTCSLRKGARSLAFDSVSGTHAPLFNPRKQEWAENFRWTLSWRAKGKTPTGRATVSALGMNRPVILAIRQELARIGKFPPLRLGRA